MVKLDFYELMLLINTQRIFSIIVVSCNFNIRVLFTLF